MKPAINCYVLIAQQSWALNLGSNARNIAVELSHTHKVMYVNPALDINTLVKNLNKAKGWQRLQLALGIKQNTQQVAPNLWVHTPATIGISINWLNNVKLFNTINRFNAFTFCLSLKKALKLLNWKKEELAVFNDSQMFTGRFVKKYIAPSKNFYYIRDNLVHHPYFKKHGVRIEPQTIQQADAIFANSSYLADYAKQFNQNSYDIGQGCEVEMYDASINHQQPADLDRIPYPRIGYAGFLTGERLDICLLENLAIEKPLWHFVLIGPEEIMFQQSKLHQLPNVHFLGSKKGSELPAYLQHVDVCINPQLVNELTIGNYPRKIDEYLALGKPTVATNTPAMQMFLPHVYLAIGVAGYIHALQQALKPVENNQKTAAIQFASSHTWQACIHHIIQYQNNIVSA